MLACRNIVGRRQTTDLSDVWCGRSESALIQLTSGVANAATCSHVMLDGSIGNYLMKADDLAAKFAKKFGFEGPSRDSSSLAWILAEYLASAAAAHR
jgi:hypothetical protein